MKHLVAYWEHRRILSRAFRRISTEDGAGYAAECMFRLNHVALRSSKRDLRKWSIYALKTPFIRVLYQQGYCVWATLERQDLECWDCGGRGSYDDGEDGVDGDFMCESCDGSGVYRSHQLYHFTFSINGQRYNWHQPADLVKWNVSLTTDLVGAYTYTDPKPWDFQETLQSLAELSGAVYAYCRRNGVAASDLPLAPSLPRAIRNELDDLRDLFGHRYGWYNRISRWRWLKDRAICRVFGHITNDIDLDYDGRVYCRRCMRMVESAVVVHVREQPLPF